MPDVAPSQTDPLVVLYYDDDPMLEHDIARVLRIDLNESPITKAAQELVVRLEMAEQAGHVRTDIRGRYSLTLEGRTKAEQLIDDTLAPAWPPTWLAAAREVNDI